MSDTTSQLSAASAPSRKERLTWSATDVTNQYKDLRFLSANDSMTLDTAQLVRDETVDYTVGAPRNTTITCVADVSGSLNNLFLRISSNTVTYGVWMNIGGAGTVPTALMNANQVLGGTNPINAGPALTAVEVDAATNSSANTMALALFNALIGLGGTKAAFTGTIAGTATPVTITANFPGTSGNITLTFTGSNTISQEISTWNTANPATTVVLTSGDGTQTPSVGTTSLTGGLVGGIFQGPVPAANIVIVSPVVASTGEQYIIDPPDAGNSTFTMTTELTGAHIPSRISLKPGGVLASNGSAALVTNSITAVQYRAVTDYPLPTLLSMPGVALHTAAEIQAMPGLVATWNMPYYKMGRGTPLIVFPSQVGDLKGILAQVRDLSERYTVYAPNLPYSGNIIQFPWPDQGYRPESTIQRSFISFCKLLCANVGPAHMMFYSRGLGTAVTIMQQNPELVKSVILNAPLYTDNTTATPTGYMNSFNPSVATQVQFEAKLINDESKAICNATHTNPAYNSATLAQRNLTANKLEGDFGIPVATIDANRTFNDGVTTRTYFSSFRTISTSTPSANPTQGNLDGASLINLAVNAIAEPQFVPTVTSLSQSFSQVPTLILTGFSTLPPITQADFTAFALSAQAISAAVPSATLTIITNGSISPIQFNPTPAINAVFSFLAPLG